MDKTLISVDGAAQAVAAGEKAAAAGGIQIVKLAEVGPISQMQHLLGGIWGGPPGDLIALSTLKAISHSENYLYGAYAEDELVGALVGFLGYHYGELQLHSHILGVSPKSQGRNVGFALKVHQRGWAVERGIKTMTWTYDPLVRRNAYFNITKLGASVTKYYNSFYGEMNDDINGSDETDRVLVHWLLDSPRAINASGGGGVAPDMDSLLRAGAEIALGVGDAQAPVEDAAVADKLLVGIPEDIVGLRKQDISLALRWRRALRSVLGSRLNNGYTTVAMTRAGYYVLERQDSA